MKETSSKPNPVLVGIVFALCFVAITLMLFVPPDSLSVDLVYQVF
jgi:hypothetical protein